MELGIVGSPVVEGEEVSVVGVLEAGRDGETGLPAMVCQEEFAGGGSVSPGAAHGAATEEGFRGQTDEDLPYGNLLR
jgi:hypothetical protein